MNTVTCHWKLKAPKHVHDKWVCTKCTVTQQPSYTASTATCVIWKERNSIADLSFSTGRLTQIFQTLEITKYKYLCKTIHKNCCDLTCDKPHLCSFYCFVVLNTLYICMLTRQRHVAQSLYDEEEWNYSHMYILLMCKKSAWILSQKIILTFDACTMLYIHTDPPQRILYIHRESKKGDTILLSISLLDIDRFSQFFHRRTQLEICNKIINEDPTSPQMCCYTTALPCEMLKKIRKTSNNLNQVSCLTVNQQIFNELHEPYPR